MKLLFDANLSPRLPTTLADIFPGSVHVRDLGLGRANDVTTDDILRRLRQIANEIESFASDETSALLTISGQA